MPKQRRRGPSVAPLMELATSFWAFKTLAAALELELFSGLSRTRGTTPRELAEKLGIAERPAEMLLTGCASLGLLGKSGGRYRNSALAEEFLVPGRPYYFGGFVAMLDQRLYAGWARLVEAIRTNRPTTWDPARQASLFDGVDPVMLAHFWDGMHSISSATGRALASKVDLRRHARLLDVGGGSGAYDIELCRRQRHLRATIYDLPHVAEIAAKKVAEAGLASRIETRAGDFFADLVYPPGHDAILLSMILHDWSEADGRKILRKCREALPDGGVLIVCELLVNDAKTGPPAAALMSLNMLIETTGGRNYTAAEYTAWLREAGFRKVRKVRLDAAGADAALIATR